MTLTVSRKSVLSLNELGQMNGKAGAGGGLSEDEEMPAPHEMGEELAFTGRYVFFVEKTVCSTFPCYKKR